jgi:hypothetical protein
MKDPILDSISTNSVTSDSAITAKFDAVSKNIVPDIPKNISTTITKTPNVAAIGKSIPLSLSIPNSNIGAVAKNFSSEIPSLVNTKLPSTLSIAGLNNPISSSVNGII